MSVCLAETKTETVDNLLLQWEQIEAQRHQIQQQWQVRKNVLEQQLQLVESERTELTRLLNEKGSANTKAETERQQLLEQQSSLEAQQADLQHLLSKAKSQIMAVYSQLPPVLQTSWQPDIEYLSLDSQTESETLNHIAEALKKLHAFNQRIVLHQTVMNLEVAGSSKQIQVKQIFLGASKAWYISADHTLWGTGQPTPDGWQWHSLEQSNPELADELTTLVVSLEQPAKAKWADLPYVLPQATTTSKELN